MSQTLTSLIINLLDSNISDSIILAKMLYGKIGGAHILRGKHEYHFALTYMVPPTERIYVFNADDVYGWRLLDQSATLLTYKAYPYPYD